MKNVKNANTVPDTHQIQNIGEPYFLFFIYLPLSYTEVPSLVEAVYHL